LAGLVVIIIAEIYVNRQCCPAGDEFKMKNRRFILNTINGSLLFGLGAACKNQKFSIYYPFLAFIYRRLK